MTFVSPTSGNRVNRMWQLPTSHAELVERRQALEAWAELTCGMLGRSPDHVASCVSGMYMGLDLFERHDPRRAAAVRDYYEYARDNDLYLTYVIISPQADRSKSAGEQSDEFLVAGVCDEDQEGITIRGAKMLGTGCPLANEVFVGAIQPLKPGEEKHSFTAMVPLNAKGLKILSRKSFEAHATVDGSTIRCLRRSTRTTRSSTSTTSRCRGSGCSCTTTCRWRRRSGTRFRRTSTRTTSARSA